MLDRQVGQVVEDHGLRLPLGQLADRVPEIQRRFQVGFRLPLICGSRHVAGATSPPPKDVQSRCEDPAHDPTLVMKAIPTLERPRERLLGCILSFISAAGDAISDAVSERKHLLIQAAEPFFVGRHSETVPPLNPSTFPIYVQASTWRVRLTRAAAPSHGTWE
jgi:hypothetical protein